MKKMIGSILAVGGVVCCIIVMFAIGFLVYAGFTGKGRIEPFYDENHNVLEGSVAERVNITINGKDNGMIIRGRDVTQPVLLFISGGPGVPEYWLNENQEKMPNKLEDYFTVCWWDYVGEGLSYDAEIKPQDISFERLEQDAMEVVTYLKNRFNKEKIYLMAHSAGTPLGIVLADKYPEQFYCYFGMGQVVSELRFGKRDGAGYYFMKDIFEKTNQLKLLEKMNTMVEIAEDGTVIPNEKCTSSRWESLLLAAGCATTREMRSDVFEIFVPQMCSQCYTFTEKINYWRGKSLCSQSVYKKQYKNDYLDMLDDTFEIPIYFFSGYYDYTTPVIQTQEYYEVITAPDKEMCIFEDSAHSPLWEENDKVLDFMKQCVAELGK